MERKKKPNTQAQRHLAAQYRANFFRKMKLIIDSVCGTNIYPLIPQSVLDDAYLCRSAPFKIIAAYNNNIPSKLLKDTKVILPNLIKQEIISLPPVNLEISLNDFYTVLFTIIILQARISETSFNNAHKVKAALAQFVSYTSKNREAKTLLYNILNSYNFGYNDLRKTLYWFKHDIVLPKALPAETENIIHAYSLIPETINVRVDDISRPAIRVGWALPYTGAEWVSIKPSVLGFKGPFSEIPLKVYIQLHAINRLLERIDCFWQGIIQFNMFCSLAKPKYTYDNNNNLLIEYIFFGTKAGYFRADIIDGIILLRTFLFITNNGTPEGQLLEKNTGLKKLDKKYLAIDKLSTFMTADLDKNDEVQRIFKTSGCQCLLDLYEKMKPLVTKHANGFDSELMLKYITNPNTEIADN
ncbi:MAG: hypothetical protein Q8928_03350 [Bacteroidota bacterium]|nr:hypothetical protein [Bacteroidota bacterium]